MPPQDPQNTGAGHIDLTKVLLPKKEAPGQSPDSAQRVNAGVLFEQEQRAGQEGAPAPAPAPAPTPAPLAPANPVPTQAAGGELAPAPSSSDAHAGPTPAPAAKPEPSLVRPLQTYQGDIESLVGQKQVSVVGIAAAEAQRREQDPLVRPVPEYAQQGSSWLRRTLIVGGGVVLLAAALGLGFYIFLRLQPVAVSDQLPAPFMLVDETEVITLTTNDGRSSLMKMLVDARDGLGISLGLVARLLVVEPTATGDAVAEVGAPEFLQTLAPKVPPTLVRTLEPRMLLGVHNYGDPEAFMILKADSFETAYAGMLSWEATLHSDLLPLFAHTPPTPVRQAPAANMPVVPLPPMATTTASSTTTATTTKPAATSTAVAASTTQPVATSTPVQTQVLQGSFVDQIVANHNSRVLQDSKGNMLLMWTMLDRSTIVITTNESTLREGISRLSQTSVLSLPAAQ